VTTTILVKLLNEVHVCECIVHIIRCY
jgi:hypothetical protein